MPEFEQQLKRYATENRLQIDSILEFFNNWLGNLPGGDRRRVVSAEKWDHKEPGWWQGRSYAEFVTDIDAALVESGLDWAEIEKSQTEIREQKNWSLGVRAKAKLNLVTITFPAFILLRASNYSHQDLIR